MRAVHVEFYRRRRSLYQRPTYVHFEVVTERATYRQRDAGVVEVSVEDGCLALVFFLMLFFVLIMILFMFLFVFVMLVSLSNRPFPV